jgi:predicted DNA-binding transcriptional regulator AlpA
MSEAHLRLPTVRARVGLSTSTIYARMAAHDFPMVRKDGAISYWLESEIAAYLAKVEARSSVGPDMGRCRQPKKKAA